MAGSSTLVTQLDSPPGQWQLPSRASPALSLFFSAAGATSPARLNSGASRGRRFTGNRSKSSRRSRGREHRAEVSRLRQRLAEVEGELQRLQAEARERRPLTVTLDAGMQAEFASVGQAEGVSLG